ncbi:MAG: hypothetical protein ACOCVR_03350 [Myxococcota bacterium]
MRKSPLWTLPCALLLVAAACGQPANDDANGNGEVESAFEGYAVTVEVAGSPVEIDLGEVDATTFEGADAVRLSRVVEQAALESPWNHHYSFEAADGWNLLNDRLEGDPSTLPYYGELEQGFIVHCESEEDGLCLAWDPALDVPGYLRVKQMNGGIIEAVEIAETTMLVVAGEARKAVDLSTLETIGYVDYNYPEDGEIQAIPFLDILDAAGVADASAFGYKMYGNDGFSNNDENLMAYENAEHAYVRPDTRRVLLDEEWDTDECCWRVSDTVLVLGIPVEG